MTDVRNRALPRPWILFILTLSILLFLASPPSATADRPLFDAGRLFNTECEPRSGATGDFDGNGDVDIALVCPDSGVIVLLNDGRGGFGEPQHLSVPDYAGWYVVAFDVDNDGDIDLACRNEDALQVLKNNGQGVFWVAQSSPTDGRYLWSMTHGDFDGDGNQDVAGLFEYGEKVLVLWGSGNGLFSSYYEFDLDEEAETVEAADLNGDGLPDLVLDTDSILLSFSQGNRTFTPAQPLLEPGEWSSSPAVADMDGDGFVDLASAIFVTGGTREIVFFWGAGDGTFPSSTRYEQESRLSDFVTGDLDNDGDTDLMVELVGDNESREQVRALVNNGNRTFTDSPPSTLAGWLYEHHLFDTDGDSFPDLVAVDENGSSGQGGVMVFRGNGDGTIASPRREPIHEDSAYFVCDDFNQDGWMDLAISAPDYSYPELHVWLGNSDGSFDGPAVYQLDDDLYYLETADFNLDRYPDLLTRQGGLYEIRPGTASGGFQSPQAIDTGHPHSFVAIADLNQDGIPDLAISSRSDTVVSVLLGDGAGGFLQQADLPAGVEPFWVTAADFTGDGWTDLAVEDSGTFPDEEVHVFSGNGDGSFGAPVTSTAPFSAWDLIPGDLDGDGHTDLVVGDDNHYSFSVMMGNGDGTFDAYVKNPPGLRMDDLQVADVNGDGTLQVLAHMYQDHDVVLYSVDAGGTAVAADCYGVSRATTDIRLADMDGDGDPELLLCAADNAEDPAIWIVNNRSATGTFFGAGPGAGPANPPRVRLFGTTTNNDLVNQWDAYGAGGYGVNVALGDLDGDGNPDVVTGPGPGTIYGPHVRGFRASGDPIPGISYFAYGTLKYGVNVALGDIDHDGHAEIITGAGPGAVFGPHVRGWNWDGAGVPQPIPGISYFAYGTPKWGVNVSCGDIDGDGFDEIVTGAGPGAVYGPHVRGWNSDGGPAAAIPQVSFLAYGTNKYGVNVTCGDIDGDGIDEIVTGAGPGAVFYPHVRAWNWDGSGAVASISAVSFIAYDLTQWGVNVGAGDLDDDGIDEIITGAGPGVAHTAHVRGWNYDGSVLTPTNLDFDAFTTVVDGFGVKVAGVRSE